MTTMFRSMRGRHMALAIALATGTILTTGVIADPAHAQRKKRGGGADYSDAFRAAYGPIAEDLNSETADVATLTAAVPAIVASLETADDKEAGGQAIYSIGRRANDLAMQVQGLDLRLSSGKLTPEQAGPIQFAAYQLSTQAGNYAAARGYLDSLAASNFPYSANMSDGSTRTFGTDDYILLAFESFVDENKEMEGLQFLSGKIDQRVAAGTAADESWIRRGISVADGISSVPMLGKFAQYYVTLFPSDSAWRDAIAVSYNAGGLDGNAMLDLLRLGRRVNGLQNAIMYNEYIDSADPRRLPQEVVAVIDEGIASGVLNSGDAFVADSRAEASRRVQTDLADLPALASDARASGARVNTVVAAADTFLSYGQPAAAEEFYLKALPMPGVDQARALTRLGIAQLDQGKHAEAQATFARVQGPRAAIAGLWATYASQQAAPATTTAAAPTT